MPDQRDRFVDFPKDDHLWWIRWVDRYRFPYGRTQTPSVDVLLSPLPTDWRFGASPNSFIKQATNWLFVPTLVGAIPGLKIGSVFRNGERRGELPTAPCRFLFTRSTTQEQVCPVNTELVPPPPNWSAHYRVLNVSENPLRSHNLEEQTQSGPISFLKSNCVVLRQRDQTVVIPCHEVFRALYAPHQRIAEALLKGAWDITMKEVVKPEDTFVREDGTWQLVLNKFIPDEYALWIANLIFNEFGRSAARAIYAENLRANPGIMYVPIPFEWKFLELHARCFLLRKSPPKFLVVEITSISWPNPKQQIVIERENSGRKGAQQTPIDKPSPFSGIEHSPDLTSDPIDVFSDDDPETNSIAAKFFGSRPEWLNAPEVGKFTRDLSHSYEDETVKVAGEEVLEGTSPGIETGAKTDRGKTEYLGRHETSARLTELADMLELLVSNQAIVSWAAISRINYPIRIEELNVWPLPDPLPNSNRVRANRWCYLDKDSERRRCALVCEIALDNTFAYWLEVECTESSLTSLLFTIRTDDVQEVIQRLLRTCVQHRGVWSNAGEDIRNSGASAFIVWKHSYIKSTQKLNHHRALIALRRLIGS